MKTFKQLLFFMVAGMLSVAVNAQELFVGGSIYAYADRGETSVGGTSSEDDKMNAFGINPKVGIFVSDQIAFGVGLDFDRTKNISADDSDVFTVENEIDFEPFARYYVVSGGDFEVFAEGGLGIGIERSKQETGDESIDGPKVTNFEIYVMPAISYALSENFIIEASLGSVYFDNRKSVTEGDPDDQEDKDSVFGFNFGINSINFGAIFILP